MAGSLPVKLFNGKFFPSLAACAKAIGMKRETLWGRLERGEAPFTDRQPKRGRPPQKTYFRGKMYPSAKMAALVNNVSKSLVSYEKKKLKNS